MCVSFETRSAFCFISRQMIRAGCFFSPVDLAKRSEDEVENWSGLNWTGSYRAGHCYRKDEARTGLEAGRKLGSWMELDGAVGASLFSLSVPNATVASLR